jgi:hypothetical protein
LPYYQLQASARRTSETGFGSWQTPTANEAGDKGNSFAKRNGDRSELCAPTLGAQVAKQLAAWPTTTIEDARSSRRHGYMITGNQGTTLTDAAHLAAWVSPAHRDYRHANTQTRGERGHRASRGEQLNNQAVHLTSGHPPSGSPAPTAKPGQLNSGMSRWLQGFPIAWDMCAPEKAGRFPRSSSGRKPDPAG